jgi:hypothetical protein
VKGNVSKGKQAGRAAGFALFMTSLVALSAVGCAAEPEDADQGDTVTSEAAATSSALVEMAGEWRFHSTRLAARPEDLPSTVRVELTADARGPDGEAWGTTLRLMRGDAPTLELRDRAPFHRVGERRACENLPMGGGKSLSICHESRLSGAELVHSVTAREWTYVVPGGASEAKQFLALVDGKLRYRYEVDGEVVEELLFTR